MPHQLSEHHATATQWVRLLLDRAGRKLTGAAKKTTFVVCDFHV